jgi:hypothetical protein
MKKKPPFFLFLLCFCIPFNAASRFWEYLENLGIEKLANLLQTSSKRLKQQSLEETKQKQEFLNFDIDMFNISYIIPTQTTESLIFISETCSNFNNSLKKQTWFAYMKKKLFSQRTASPLYVSYIEKLNVIKELIKRFNTIYFEQLQLTEQEKNKYHITWTKKTKVFLGVRKTHINALYTQIEQYKSNFVEPKIKLLVLHKKWTTIHNILQAKTESEIRTLSDEFSSFLIQQISFITKLTQKVTPEALQTKIDLFNTEAILEDNNIKSILQQDTIEKELYDLFFLKFDQDFGSSIFKQLVKNYHDLLQAALEKTLLPYTENNAIAVENFIVNEKEKNQQNRMAAYKKIEEYMNHNNYELEKNETTQEVLIIQKSLEQPLKKNLTATIDKQYQKIREQQNKLVDNIIKNIKNTKMKEDLLTRIRNLNIKPREEYRIEADKKRLSNLKNQLKNLEQDINNAIKHEQPSVFTKIKGFFGGPKTVTQYQKDKIETETNDTIVKLHFRNNQLAEPSSSIQARLNGIQKKFIAEIQNIQTETEFETLRQEIKQRLENITKDLTIYEQKIQ